MNTNMEERPQLDPYEVEGFYVLCEELIAVGMPLKFGDKLPDYVDLHHLHTHYQNGVVGTKAEVESLLEPIELAEGFNDPIMPIALFTTNPEVKAPIEEAEERGVFAMENAKLLKGKDDLVAYAAMFGIKLKKASNINLKKMLENLEAEAKEKGLL